MELKISTSAIAVYGAVVATISLIIALYVAVRDRARMMIFLRCGIMIKGPQPLYDPKKIYVAVDVANRGRRPVTISTVGFTLRNAGTRGFVLSDCLRGEREVNEGKSTTYLADQEQGDWTSIGWVWVRDATGRMYKKRVTGAFLKKIQKSTMEHIEERQKGKATP